MRSWVSGWTREWVKGGWEVGPEIRRVEICSERLAYMLDKMMEERDKAIKLSERLVLGKVTLEVG